MRLDPKPLAAAADRWPVALAFAFVVAVWAFMLGFANTQARPGLIAAGTVLLAIAALQVLRRRAVLGGSEIALYWLGCGIAMALSAFTLVDRHAGALIASLIALTSAAAIVARWRKGRLGGVEIALYWLGCSVAAATATVILIEWAGAEGFAVGPAGGFWGAAMTVLFALIIIYRRRAVLEGTEVALYWAGCSVALFVAAAALMIPMFAWTGSSLILIAPLIALVSAAVLIRRRRTRLGGIELFIYWLGCAIATAGLIAPAFYALGFGVGPGLLVALAAGVVSGVIIVVRRRSAARKAKADPQPHSLSY